MFKEVLQDVVDRTEGGVAGLLMGFDGIPVDHYVREAATPPVDVETVGMEFSVILKDIREDVLAKAQEVAENLATGQRHAMRFTKRALNQWLLQAGPIFDHSLALEMLGFFGEDMMKGVDGLRKRRKDKK